MGVAVGAGVCGAVGRWSALLRNGMQSEKGTKQLTLQLSRDAIKLLDEREG